MFFRRHPLRFTLLVVFGIAAAATSQTARPAGQAKVQRGNIPNTASVIEGDPYTVPTLRFKLSKDGTQEPLAGAKISVLYVWEWLLYPYPEHPCGAFTSATERIEVSSADNGYAVLPEHTVRPTGYSSPPKCWWWPLTHADNPKGKPYFENIEIRIDHPDYATGMIWGKREIERRSSKDIVLAVPPNILRNGYGQPIDKMTGKPLPTPH
jgi:hypothetical protein